MREAICQKIKQVQLGIISHDVQSVWHGGKDVKINIIPCLKK